MHRQAPSESTRRFAQSRTVLLREREGLLVKYCRLLSLDMDDRDFLLQDLTEFNQDLTDYVAFGHFEVMEPTLSESHTVPRGNGVLQELEAKIRRTTEQLLTFSDRYRVGQAEQHRLDTLSSDLDTLGQVMADRFELEDRFLKVVAQRNGEVGTEVC